VKLSEIAAANSISDPKTIHPGQELIIPGGRQPAAVKSAVAPAPAPAEAAPAAAPAAAELPRPDQDLDAGLKPSANSDIPVVKVDDSNAQQK
jgi:LysM repeat protein